MRGLELRTQQLLAKKRKGILHELKKNAAVYMMFIPVGLLLLLFNYFPMAGLVIAFKDFNFTKGIFGSDWMNPIFSNFDYLFTSSSAFRAIKNTISLNMLFILVGLIFEIGLALVFNEIRNKYFKRISQSITFLPYFISWIVVGVFAYSMLSDIGSLNAFLKFLGFSPVDFYNKPGLWPIILTFIIRWKVTGYGSVIYMATLAGVDSSYYEAAAIDGANKWQQIRHISLPMLKPTVIILTLLAIGRVMNADFGMFYAVIGDSSPLYPTTDVIDTFVYRSLRVTGDIGMASAAGFLQSTISFILILGSNLIARKLDRDAALF
jgi:putative aldouronate transport system permease protein